MTKQNLKFTAKKQDVAMIQDTLISENIYFEFDGTTFTLQTEDFLLHIADILLDYCGIEINY